MTADNYLLSVLDGSRRDPAAGLLRAFLTPLAYVYSTGLKLYLLPYRVGLRRQARLPCAVISIGNLTVGGTGKTPMTRRVCEILRKHGLKVCVLSRGYRGAHEYGAAVVSSESRVELAAREAGDEAHLLARSMPGIPVVVGKDRRVTGRLAYDRFRPDVIVLDDGMQYYQLHRDLDIALLDAQRPFDNGWTFPRGLLREPPSHLRRAGCAVITNVDKVPPESVERLRTRMMKLAHGIPVLTAQYAPASLRPLDNSAQFPPEWLRSRKVALLCALGNPESFARQAAGLGAEIVHSARFPDHHEVTAGELNGVIERACEAGAEAVITTEKDAVKLPPIMRPLPFYALAVAMVVNDERKLAQILLEAVRK